ncbi:hypothetical protein LshimejAT787_1103850 [Lyophyllum shimeji]|uniref:Uncharacterized protein n=1 Tax=Lyophyllum shimeji TaxID=47721 RepID=A0A9P3USE3_LYOSH|nr:hypothetical protein LshimejAT787_1103850 [Lyophyllum shimeji]
MPLREVVGLEPHENCLGTPADNPNATRNNFSLAAGTYSIVVTRQALFQITSGYCVEGPALGPRSSAILDRVAHDTYFYRAKITEHQRWYALPSDLHASPPFQFILAHLNCIELWSESRNTHKLLLVISDCCSATGVLEPHAMTNSKFSSDAAQLVAVFVECIFYGLYLVTFAVSLKCILWSSPERTLASRLASNWSMFTVVMLMFNFLTLNLALGLVRLLQGLVYHSHTAGGSIAELGQDWVNIVKPLTVHLQTITADMVLIYRCWIMCDKRRRMVLLPILLWLGGVGVTALSMYQQGVLTFGSRVNGGAISHVYISFWSSTIVLNLYATTLIVLRIWRAVNQTAKAQRLSPLFSSQSQTRVQLVMRIVIESALVYTIMSFIVFINQLTGSTSVYITTAAEIQLSGIAFNLILIRAKHASDHATVATAGDLSAHLSFAHPTQESRKREEARLGAVGSETDLPDSRGTHVGSPAGFSGTDKDFKSRHSSSF